MMPLTFDPVPVIPTATTASPDLVARIISPSSSLRAKTRAFVRTREANRDVLQVYRDSSSARGKWSCDEYPVLDGKLGPRSERAEKYEPSQVPPPQAKCTIIDGLPYYTLDEITRAEVDELRRLLASLTAP